MSTTLIPDLLTRPGPGETGFTEDASELFGDSGFPEELMLLQLPDGRHGCINCQPIPVEAGYTVNCLAVFSDQESLNEYREASGLIGKGQEVNLSEAREIALAKPAIVGLALQIHGKTVALHYVR